MIKFHLQFFSKILVHKISLFFLEIADYKKHLLVSSFYSINAKVWSDRMLI